jgi:heme-degrading monooxygenase HmoA
MSYDGLLLDFDGVVVDILEDERRIPAFRSQFTELLTGEEITLDESVIDALAHSITREQLQTFSEQSGLTPEQLWRYRDDAFAELNERIRRIARSRPGYLGRKDWTDAEGHRAVTYYWESMEALRSFAADPDHREAKRRHREWYAGYRVEISRVLRVYGGGELDDVFGVPSESRGTTGERELGEEVDDGG